MIKKVIDTNIFIDRFSSSELYSEIFLSSGIVYQSSIVLMELRAGAHTKKALRAIRVMQKEEAHRLIDRLPEKATWDDLMNEIYIREVIEMGLEDSKAGRTRDVKEVRAKYGLPE